MDDPGIEPWLTAAQVAVILGIHVDDVYELIATGEIPARRLGRRWRIVPSELAEVGKVEPRPKRVRYPEGPPIKKAGPPPAPPPVRSRRNAAWQPPTMKDLYGPSDYDLLQEQNRLENEARLADPARKAYPFEIREWARREGLVVNDRGRVSKEITAAFHQAHPLRRR